MRILITYYTYIMTYTEYTRFSILLYISLDINIIVKC